jgi:hypothetical protein
MQLITALSKFVFLFFKYALLFIYSVFVFLIELIDGGGSDESDDFLGNHYNHLSGDNDSIKRLDGIYSSDLSGRGDNRF